jgi:drug/metabolite transporter (DMT)-like permease
MLAINALARHLAQRYPVGEVVFFRFLGALPVVAALALGAGRRALKTRRLWLHGLRALLTLGAMSALYAASRHLPFSDLIALSYAAPLVVALLAGALLGERLGASRLLLVLMGFAGVLLVACPGRLELWSLGALAMAVLNAGATICTARLGRTDAAAGIAFYFTLFGALLALPCLAFGWTPPSLADLGILAGLGLLAGLAVKLHAEAFRRAPASLLAQIDYGAVALSIPLGFALWGESPDWPTLAGGLVILVAGILQLRAAERGVTPAPARLRLTHPPVLPRAVERA